MSTAALRASHKRELMLLERERNRWQNACEEVSVEWERAARRHREQAARLRPLIEEALAYVRRTKQEPWQSVEAALATCIRDLDSSPGSAVLDAHDQKYGVDELPEGGC